MARLEEKLIIHGRKAQYVIVVGGSGAGKGFVIDNMLDTSKFKIMDVDKFKRYFIKARDKNWDEYVQRHGKDNPDLLKADMKNSDDVGKLHAYFDKKNMKKLAFDLLQQQKRELPNVIIDITGDQRNKIDAAVKQAIDYGYEPIDISLVYVLTSVNRAIKQNAERERSVSVDTLIDKHSGAAQTFLSLINSPNPDLNGRIDMVVNLKEKQVSKIVNGKPVLLDFEYLMIKKKGLPPNKQFVKHQIEGMISDLVFKEIGVR